MGVKRPSPESAPLFSEKGGGGHGGERTASPRGEALRVLNAMRRATPIGCDKPWRSEQSISIVADLLSCDDVHVETLIEIVKYAAHQIELGQQDRRWWHVRNLFGTPLDQWRADWAADTWRSGDAEQNRRNLEAVEARIAAEPQAPAKVSDMEFRQIVADARRAFATQTPTEETTHDRRSSQDRTGKAG